MFYNQHGVKKQNRPIAGVTVGHRDTVKSECIGNIAITYLKGRDITLKKNKHLNRTKPDRVEQSTPIPSKFLGSF